MGPPILVFARDWLEVHFRRMADEFSLETTYIHIFSKTIRNVGSKLLPLSFDSIFDLFYAGVDG